MILNLVKPEKSHVPFSISKFPDGQRALNLFNYHAVKDQEIEIYSRMNSWNDLQDIICANQALQEAGASSVSLYVPYFLGARSDRKFSKSGVNYLKKVICPIINSQKFARVKVLDPHSDVLEACLDNFEKVDNVRVVQFTVEKIYGSQRPSDWNFLLVSPDAGALKKVYHVAESLAFKDKVIIASKHRDLATGKITHTEVSIDPHDVQKDLIIVDDICDGGRTFIELSKAIHQSRSLSSVSHDHGKIYLIVTHGIFSAGLYELSKHFDGVFCTNSVQDIDVTAYSDYTVEEGFLNQLEVFA
jgi:ribose-phosphate pyrophosphokinase